MEEFFSSFLRRAVMPASAGLSCFLYSGTCSLYLYITVCNLESAVRLHPKCLPPCELAVHLKPPTLQVRLLTQLNYVSDYTGL